MGIGWRIGRERKMGGDGEWEGWGNRKDEGMGADVEMGGIGEWNGMKWEG